MASARLALAALLWLTHVWATSNQASGAEVEISKFDPFRQHVIFKMKGEIKRGDLGELQARAEFLKLRTGPKGGSIRLIVFGSSGGDVQEAMRIGRWLRENEFTVLIYQECASACVYILAAGVERIAPDEVAVLVHRPYLLDQPSTGSLHRTMGELLQLSRDYFAEMNIPEALADEMFSVEPAQSRRLTAREIAFYRLNQQDMAYHEAQQISAAKRLGIDRGEYLTRLRAYQDAGASQKCLKERFPERQISCLTNEMRRFGLMSPDD
ncbi:MAG: hypothetical protein H7X78_08100 [Methyloceanibacter sp.]|jgi:ATP-dependent protease ClpP protease subunit|nr:hypothetical protein [Methyloceanibacter sp.]